MADLEPNPPWISLTVSCTSLFRLLRRQRDLTTYKPICNFACDMFKSKFRHHLQLKAPKSRTWGQNMEWLRDFHNGNSLLEDGASSPTKPGMLTVPENRTWKAVSKSERDLLALLHITCWLPISGNTEFCINFNLRNFLVKGCYITLNTIPRTKAPLVPLS